MRLAATVLASALVTGVSVICCIDPAAAQRGKVAARSEFAKQNDTCFQCHSALNPGLAQESLASAHGQKGVGCYDCHRAEKPTAMPSNIMARRSPHRLAERLRGLPPERS